ncbi:MAG: MOSC domain-containing protein [Cellvibrionaceae bacterium]
MQVISVNMAMPTEVAYQEGMVTTGIFKKPVKGAVRVRSESLEGDAQADLINHGGVDKAVYAFSSDHYEYWRTVLGNPGLGPGAFGENLTVSELDESALCIGDRFSIRDCVLEVSQPRVPCFKLGIALNNTRAPKLFTKSFRTGVYFRVAEEGVVEAGDQLIKVGEAADSVSVESLFRAYFDKAYAAPEVIFSKALRLEQLAAEWREMLKKRMLAGS